MIFRRNFVGLPQNFAENSQQNFVSTLQYKYYLTNIELLKGKI
jgi:hypothetical protein